MTRRFSRVFCILVCMYAVSIGRAAPTMDLYPRAVHGRTFDTASLYLRLEDQLVNTTYARPAEDPITATAPDYAKRDLHSTTLAAPTAARALPPVPDTLFMVLTGFLCISLVRDRKAWLTGLAAALWLGQVAVYSVPRLAYCIIRDSRIRKPILVTPLPARPQTHLHSTESTRYVGLLRHLVGIPDSLRRSPVMPSSVAALPAEDVCDSAPCTAIITDQFSSFAPVFIFGNLARGPPPLAREETIESG